MYKIMNNIMHMLDEYQAHTCKTLGVVTTLLARMRRCIRVIISSRVVELISYTRPRPAPLTAGRGREYEIRKYELACMSREAPRFLAL